MTPHLKHIFSGHSLRVMGAQFLAGMGMPIEILQLLARHQSDIIMRYVAEAPLLNLTDEYRSLSSKSKLKDLVSGMRCEVADLVSVPSTMDEGGLVMLKKSLDALHEKIKNLEIKANRFVVNVDSGKVHRHQGATDVENISGTYSGQDSFQIYATRSSSGHNYSIQSFDASAEL